MTEISQYKIIFFLSSILVITTVIGEFSRIETLKEGMGFGALIVMFIKLVMCSVQFFIMIFMIIWWLIQLALLWFIPKFIPWALLFIICAFTKFMNIPNCFLWYAMEIAGKIIYLPFRITFALLDFILEIFGINIRIQVIINQIWWLIDDISHAIYDGGGYHVVHYPDDVIERCYTCKIGNFPDLPKFPMSSVMAFIKCIK